MGRKWKSKIKNSKLEVLEGTHGVPLESPVEVANIIHNFIQND
ncbi:MAG: hypothetical protein Q9M91_02575 [Candidatus Dojkabacteria bacterium]|nr:hypothetical protein [Candidatus Dojkabacteria bacterium]